MPCMLSSRGKLLLHIKLQHIILLKGTDEEKKQRQITIIGNDDSSNKDNGEMMKWDIENYHDLQEIKLQKFIIIFIHDQYNKVTLDSKRPIIIAQNEENRMVLFDVKKYIFCSKQFELDMKQKGRCETPLEYGVLYYVK